MGVDVYFHLWVQEGETVDDAIADFLNRCDRWRSHELDHFDADMVRAFRLVRRLYNAAGRRDNGDELARKLIKEVFHKGDDESFAMYKLICDHVLFHMQPLDKLPILEVGRLHQLLPEYDTGGESCGDIDKAQDLMTILTNLGVDWMALGRIESVTYG